MRSSSRRAALSAGRLLALACMLTLASLLAGAAASRLLAAENRPQPAKKAPPSPSLAKKPAAAETALTVLSQVGPEGADNEKAARAWRELVAKGPDELPRLLAALDRATPLGANWIRAAIDAIAERELAAGGALPADKLEAFFADRSHSPRARRLAYEWLARVDAHAVERLLPTLLDDPSVELRRDAVAQALDRAAALAKQIPIAKQDPAAKPEPSAPADQAAPSAAPTNEQRRQSARAVIAYSRALAAARDEDQVKAASDALKELGKPVDLAAHYGFVRDWRIIGPFDNAGKRGFAIAYPPETGIDLAAEYEGKFGPVRWIETTTTDDLGQVDLNKLLVKEKGVVAYALAERMSERDQAAEVRVGSECALKIWLNDELVFDREVYHALVRMDQYVAPIRLRAGRNKLLIKICQNEQTEAWAVDWKFQARICDASGTPIALSRPPSEKETRK